MGRCNESITDYVDSKINRNHQTASAPYLGVVGRDGSGGRSGAYHRGEWLNEWSRATDWGSLLHRRPLFQIWQAGTSQIGVQSIGGSALQCQSKLDKLVIVLCDAI